MQYGDVPVCKFFDRVASHAFSLEAEIALGVIVRIRHEHEMSEIAALKPRSETRQRIRAPDVRAQDQEWGVAQQRQRFHDASRRFERMVAFVAVRDVCTKSS